MNYLKPLLALVFICIGVVTINAQNNESLDKIIAVVGDQIVLRSEVNEQLLQLKEAGETIDNDLECNILEQLLFGKLLITKAEEDSIYVSDDQVEFELERRMRFFISQFGSQEKMEKFYGKSILELKADLRDLVADQLTVQTMQQNLTADAKVTPADVKAFFNSIPKDSLPYVDSEVQVAQIVKKPPISEEEKDRIKTKLNEFRDRVNNGEDFGTIAFLYSEDPGSARENGELGFMTRNMLVPEFARVLFSMQPGQVSNIVETEYGFHLIQLIEKRGQEANGRHILLKPRVKPEDLYESKLFLDSILTILKSADTIKFEDAAAKYSDDDDTKNNGGVLMNPMTGTSRFEMDELSKVDPSLFFLVSKIKKGEMSSPEVWNMQDGSKAYRIVKLISISEPHVANLKQDYNRLQTLTRSKVEADFLNNWVSDNLDKYYIKVDPSFNTCKFRHNWVKVKN